MKHSKERRNCLFNKPEVEHDRLKLFQDIISHNHDYDNTDSISHHFATRNLRAVKYGAIIIIVTTLFWLIVDIYKGGSMNLTSGPALITIIVEIFFSIYMLLLPRFAHKCSDRIIRYSFLAYYICLIITVCALTVTKNAVMVAAGNKTSVTGIPLSTYYLLILVLAPLPSRNDSILLGIAFVIMEVIPAFLPGHELYKITQQVILSACMIVAYWYVRGVNIALSKSMKQLSILSYTDSLTNVLNRRSLNIYWEEICKNKRASSAGILMFDIDDFKKYNDKYTHAKGDDILIKVCEITIKVLKDKPGFLFRYGGEEFTVILLDYNDEELVDCAKQINKAIYDANIERDDGSDYNRITITVGCSHEEINEFTPSDCISRADKELYIGKNSGKNCVVFNGNIIK